MTSFQVVYVVSRGHSGSTLLDLLVSTHSQVISTGEAKMLYHHPNKRCTCGAASWEACPFWSAVDRRLQADSGSGLADIPLDSDDLSDFARANRAFFSAVHAVSGKRMLLDSSKSITRLEKLLVSGLDVRSIHLLRDPRGVVYSNVKKGRKVMRYCRSYVREHLHAAYVLRGHPHIEVTYEELAREPRRELERIVRFLGLEPEPERFDEWRKLVRHNYGGNKMRFGESDEIRLDESWRSGLRANQKLWIRASTFPARFRHGAMLSLAHRVFVGKRGISEELSGAEA